MKKMLLMVSSASAFWVNNVESMENYSDERYLADDRWDLGNVQLSTELKYLHISYRDIDKKFNALNKDEWTSELKDGVKRLLETLPESVTNKNTLEVLHVNGDKKSAICFEILPDSISNLVKLYSLSLTYSNLQDLPLSIGNLTNLRTLDLFNNNITKFPEAITSLTNLYSLNLRKNKLNELPESIVNLQNLKSLDLRENELYHKRELKITYSNIPEKIEDFLGNLEELYLPYLISFPSGTNSCLNVIPVDIFMEEHIKMLFVKDLKIKKIPRSFGRLEKLKTLDLVKSELDTLPDFLWSMPALEEIKIANNLIKFVPKNAKIESDKTINRKLSEKEILDFVISIRKNHERWSRDKLFQFLKYDGNCTVLLKK